MVLLPCGRPGQRAPDDGANRQQYWQRQLQPVWRNCGQYGAAPPVRLYRAAAGEQYRPDLLEIALLQSGIRPFPHPGQPDPGREQWAGVKRLRLRLQ